MTSELAARVAAIGADNQSGAAAIAVEAVLVLQEARRVDVSVVPVVATALCKAQPAMASVWNAAALSLRSDGEAALFRFGELLRRAPGALARVAVELLLAGREDGQTFSVVTVSASGSVRECLLLLSRRCRLRVLCAEGRPLLEGRVLATSLVAAGIATTVSTDAAVTSLGAKFDAVLVGADAVAADWFLNKCGTHQVVEVAATHGIPAYVAASRDKFVDPTLARMLVPTLGTDAEVWDEHPPEVEVANPYFERVPVQSLAGVITDAGLVGPGSLGEVAAGLVGQDDVGRLIAQLRRA